MTVAATTLQDIERNVEVVLGAITPTSPVEQTARWNKHDRRGGPGLRTRRYRVEFGLTELADNGWIDTFVSQHTVLCSVVADYNLPAQHVDAVISEDGAQLERALYQSLVRNEAIVTDDGNVTPDIQIIGVEYNGSAVVEQSEAGDTQSVAHDYMLHFLRDRRF